MRALCTPEQPFNVAVRQATHHQQSAPACAGDSAGGEPNGQASALSLRAHGSAAGPCTPHRAAAQPACTPEAAGAGVHAAHTSLWRWLQRWWRGAARVACSRNTQSDPPVRTWAGSNGRAEACSSNDDACGQAPGSVAAQRGGRWLPFLPLRAATPAADRAAEDAALRAVSAGRAAAADLSGTRRRDDTTQPVQAAGLHPVNLAHPGRLHRAPSGGEVVEGLPPGTASAVASAMQQAAAAPCARAAAGRARPGRPGPALGNDSAPWAPFNESELVPELSPAIMWLLEEAEVRSTLVLLYCVGLACCRVWHTWSRVHCRPGLLSAGEHGPPQGRAECTCVGRA